MLKDADEKAIAMVDWWGLKLGVLCKINSNDMTLMKCRWKRVKRNLVGLVTTSR